LEDFDSFAWDVLAAPYSGKPGVHALVARATGAVR
jgi:hypothetical protein